MAIFSLKFGSGFLLLLLGLLCFPAYKSTVSGLVAFDGERVSLDVYVLALDNVGASEAGKKYHHIGMGIWIPEDIRVNINVSRVVEGVQLAAGQVNVTGFWYQYKVELYDGWNLNVKNISASVNLVVLRDWSTYRVLIETGIDAILVNAHGEIVPIPSGYSREGWTDKIAEAMLNRRVTWVHMAGYPFYHVWHEGSTSSVEWVRMGLNA